MRSLATKLILAFLFVIFIGIGTIVVFTRFSTNREFDQFVVQRDRDEITEELARYYQLNGSWDNVDVSYIGFTVEKYGARNGRPSNFLLTDADGVVLIESGAHGRGGGGNKQIIDYATPIYVNDVIVGYFYVENPRGFRNPVESDFVNRLDSLMILTAIGAVIFALVLGVILSRTITKPIRELTAATREMAGGKLGQTVTVRSNDEIGELAKSFNKMSSDLARSTNLRKQMTADIAHELRTPLSLIIGHAEGVKDGVLEPSRENFEIIREEAGRLEQLVNDLRTLSLADAGELSVDLQPTDINVFLTDTRTRYLTLFEKHRIALNLELGSTPLQANLDPNRFAQVINNIMDNALRHTHEGGFVTVGAKHVNGKVQITIQDSGEGVTPEEASHLFDRFYRTDESRNRDEGGSGLGLAIAKSFIELHMGNVWAESEKNEGLKIFIEIPNG